MKAKDMILKEKWYCLRGIPGSTIFVSAGKWRGWKRGNASAAKARTPMKGKSLPSVPEEHPLRGSEKTRAAFSLRNLNIPRQRNRFYRLRDWENWNFMGKTKNLDGQRRFHPWKTVRQSVIVNKKTQWKLWKGRILRRTPDLALTLSVHLHKILPDWKEDRICPPKFDEFTQNGNVFYIIKSRLPSEPLFLGNCSARPYSENRFHNMKIASAVWRKREE